MEKSKAQILKEIFIGYFKSMLFAFTGGNMTLALIQQELSDKHKLIEKEKIVEYYALAQAIPGAIALNSALMIGHHIIGWAGGIAAALATIFPAFTSMLLIAIFYKYVNEVEFIKSAIEGIRVASIAIILTNSFQIMKFAKLKLHYFIIALSIVLAFFFDIDAIIIVIGCGFLGVIYYLITVKNIKNFKEGK